MEHSNMNFDLDETIIDSERIAKKSWDKTKCFLEKERWIMRWFEYMIQDKCTSDRDIGEGSRKL